jgi:hypothetical protein
MKSFAVTLNSGESQDLDIAYDFNFDCIAETEDVAIRVAMEKTGCVAICATQVNRTFAVWYDNGTNYYDGVKEVTANSVELAVAQVEPYQATQVITASWKDDPNYGGEILATIQPNYKEKIMNKAIVIGRHAGDVPGFEVIERRNINFPATADECVVVLEELFQETFEKQAALLFQAIPGQLAAGLTRIAARNVPTHISVGVIVSQPGERPAGVVYEFDHSVFDYGMNGTNIEHYMSAVVKHCNPNAKVSGNKVTVDPPMPFVFSHIEWLF